MRRIKRTFENEDDYCPGLLWKENRSCLFPEKKVWSQNTEILKAFNQVHKLFPFSNPIWVWDRGFDGKKKKKKFIGRVYHKQGSEGRKERV